MILGVLVGIYLATLPDWWLLRDAVFRHIPLTTGILWLLSLILVATMVYVVTRYRNGAYHNKELRKELAQEKQIHELEVQVLSDQIDRLTLDRILDDVETARTA